MCPTKLETYFVCNSDYKFIIFTFFFFKDKNLTNSVIIQKTDPSVTEVSIIIAKTRNCRDHYHFF